MYSAKDSVWVNVRDSDGTIHQEQIYVKPHTYYQEKRGSNSSVDGVPEHMRIYFFIAFIVVIIFFWWIIKKKK
jgi:hypothetical protein